MAKKHLEQNMNVIIEMLGLEKFEQLSKMYIENFMIQGDETEDLEELLKRAHDSLIDLICESIGTEEPELVSRKEKETQLLEAIPRYFSEQFIYINEYQMELLARLKAGMPMESLEFTNAIQLFSRFGWVFCCVKENKGTLVIAKQIQDIMEEQLADEEIRMLIALVMGIRKVLYAALHLYGVLEREQLFQLLISYLAAGGKPENNQEVEDVIYQLGNLVLENLAEREEGFWLDNNYVIIDDLEIEKDYMKLLKKSKGREDYKPDIDAIELYSESIIDQQNEHYKEVVNALQLAAEDVMNVDELMYEIECRVVEENLSSSDILSIFMAEGIMFDSKIEAEKFFRSFNNWGFEVRRWSNRGYSDKELGIGKKGWIPDVTPIVWERRERTTKIKISRNDLCPCGSGKKYKKCCLGNVT